MLEPESQPVSLQNNCRRVSQAESQFPIMKMDKAFPLSLAGLNLLRRLDLHSVDGLFWPFFSSPDTTVLISSHFSITQLDLDPFSLNDQLGVEY